jgi:hypothetical protein
MSNKDVNTPCQDWLEMSQKWQLVDDLLGGTMAMREAGPRWLPKNPGETFPAYSGRLVRTFLYNGLARTVKTLTGKPFSEDIKWNPAVEDDVKGYLNDVDKQGNDITTFTKRLFAKGLAKGLVHILVEYPQVVGRITLRDKEAQQIRPYFVAVDPENVIGWRYVMEQGAPVLTQVRMREQIQVPDGPWVERVSKRVRVYERVLVDSTPIVGYTVWEEQRGNSGTVWNIIEQGYTTLSKIPFVTVYFGEKTGVLKSNLPLEDLCWMNLEHWNSSSEQRNILHVARVPVWCLTGYQPILDDDGNPKDKIEIGPNSMIRLSSPDANLKIVEHTGKAIKSGREDLQDIEAHMAIMGSEMLAQKASVGGITATEEAGDQKAEDCELQSMTKAMEDGLTTAAKFMYEWEGKTPPVPGKLFTINTDFGLTPQDAADLQVLYQSRMAGQITHNAYLHELQRRGVLAPSTDIELLEKQAKLEGPVELPQGGDASTGTMKAKGGAGA